MTLVMIVDDVPAMAEQYAYDLKRLRGYAVIAESDGRRALERLGGEAVDCIILDLEMPGMDGFEVLRALEKRGSEVPVIVYTGTGNFDRCIQAMRLGAAGFIDKAEPMERVVHEVESAIGSRRLRGEVDALQRRLEGESSLVGTSAAITRLKETIARVAPVPSTVLITGESGTGKELVARDLHRFGPHPAGPFVAINCAALPDALIESELFGHERGAFTGASVTRKGAFESAEKGTMFLDEIGELPLASQGKLLRVLEERKVTRLGGTRALPVETRVVAATNRDLQAEVKGGRFREDLYYRMNVIEINVPPLRDRLSDVPEITGKFVAAICARFGIKRKKIAVETLEVLMAYEWRRNNVRELRNIVERMIIATDGEVIGPERVPADVRGAATPSGGERGSAGFHDQREEAERRIIIAALERNGWQITKTAAELELADHASLLKIMRRLGVKRPEPAT
ncbi:MAG: sigma-54 dependent transcriptional regulator [Gemmatimonadales bacterium]